MKILYTHFLITIFAFSITSCSNSNEAEVPASEEVVEQIEEESTSELVEDHMFYQVPTPNELFAVLKNAEVAYNRENLNDISNVNKYETKASKALNFGVYTADLAYITSLGQMDDASKFFETIRNLSKDLEIENAVDEVILKRLQSNLENSNADSLFYLSNETYYNAYSYLEENDRRDVLAMIVVGGWIEGLNIILNLEPYSEGSEVCQRIADQKLTLENLMIFTSTIENDQLSEIVGELSAVEEVFNSENTEEEAEATEFTSNESEDGVMIFGGGVSSSISEAQFNELKSIVLDLRTSIIEGI
ncbi:MAG: hypothetical protein CL832_07840 [Crocinitomicaceae bacterium]|nr:hypothetical protein [Crocinitomicaceae bacterium]|tara:strand:+ start:7556 stop:8467 length:912 start_codon:yes stop_codon:yes gene_type:complete